MILNFDKPPSRAARQKMGAEALRVKDFYHVWKAVHINAGKDDARIEVRRSFDSVQMLIVVALDGWNIKHELRGGDERGHNDTTGLNVRISTNGVLKMTFEEMNDVNNAVNEAKQILEN